MEWTYFLHSDLQCMFQKRQNIKYSIMMCVQETDYILKPNRNYDNQNHTHMQLFELVISPAFQTHNILYFKEWECVLRDPIPFSCIKIIDTHRERVTRSTQICALVIFNLNPFSSRRRDKHMVPELPFFTPFLHTHTVHLVQYIPIPK